MTAATPAYRWNTSAAAEAYDSAAPTIHPYYETVQDQILAVLPFAPDEPFSLVDLGGGSGRLAERVLDRFNDARVVVVDQSEPFLAIAERRLHRFAPRGSVIQRRVQDDWQAELPVAPNVIVSTSAIHHLEPPEKRALYARCYAALSPGGVFMNGDEYRPATDAEYLALLEKWSRHMHSALDDGRIPSTFAQTLDHWYDRNIRRFGEPKKSGDDCLETLPSQIDVLHDAGFAQTDVKWAEELWAVVLTHKLTAA